LFAGFGGFISGSAPDTPDLILRVGLNYSSNAHSRRRAGAPANLPGLLFSEDRIAAPCASASIDPTSAHFLLPKFEHSGRKFTLTGAHAPTGFGPHFKQGLIAPK
jgi:hypothetical protein